MRHLLLILAFLTFFAAFSQNDSLNKLEEVILYGNFSPSLNSAYMIDVIKDSVLQRESGSLGNLLQDQVNIYFKQNGAGMVSSVSLRGTSAAHTGVYWNGIAINSSLNGQTDFNTLQPGGFDAVDIRKGGGSVLFGSGAVGGAINLRDDLTFEPEKYIFLRAGMGSFNTYTGNLLARLGNEKFYAKISASYINSKNDYPYKGYDLKNENGEFRNYAIQSVLGWKIKPGNILSFHSLYNDSDRNTSGTLTALNNARLLNKNKRFLLSWKNLGEKYISDLKVSFLDEKYTYYFDRDFSERSENSNQQFITKYDFTYLISKSIDLKAGLLYNHSNGKGDNISKVTQDIFEAYALIRQQILPGLVYHASVRKGFSSEFEIPFIFALDLYYKITRYLSVKTNYSTNYRLPTFNDLYWEPGGNKDLESETSNTGELGILFKNHETKIEMTGYFLKSDNLIQWVPGDADFWQPENIKTSSGYGAEFAFQEKKRFGEHRFQADLQYSYTVSKDDSLDKQLIYVPAHKGNGRLVYSFKDLIFSYNLQYTGEVFTTTSNTQKLDDYWLSNMELAYQFLKKKLSIGLRMNNLFDKAYQSVAYRPMPGRNFEININYKIDKR